MAPKRTLATRGTRSTGKAARATTRLRDVSRCRVRPGDLIVHQGSSVLVTGREGWIGTGLEGFYPHQTRFLSRLRILVESAPTKAVSANEVDRGNARVALRAWRNAEGRTELDVPDADGVRIVTPAVLPPGQDRLAAGFYAMLAADRSHSIRPGA